MLFDKNTYKQPRLYLYVTLIFFILAVMMFIWQLWGNFNTSQPIDHAIWGQFGDFVGGTLGVIFSLVGVIFVVVTFQSQQRNAAEQRFNDLFFESLRMFHEQEKELQFRFKEKRADGEYSGVANYKDFFDRVKVDMLQKFQPVSSFSRNRKTAIQTYAETCVPLGGKLSVCYRSIYRLLDLINSSSISEKARLEYAKLLRAQFTENELLCLRYHIKFGDYRKFAYLVNKYNIMKHLPIFDMLEFNYWYKNNALLDIERREIGNFFIIVAKKVRKRENSQIRRCNGQFLMDIQVKSYEVKLTCTKYDLQKAAQDVLAGIYKFENQSLENLIECILKEIVVFSNFSCYNYFNELYFSSKIQAVESGVQIEASVINKKRKPLIISFKESNLNHEKMPLLH